MCSPVPMFLFLISVVTGASEGIERGYALKGQGVVTYMLPVEVFMTGIKIFDRQKLCLIA